MEVPKEIIDAWQEWKNDWCLAAKELLCVELDSRQEEILRAVQRHKMVSVVSGTARGKDFVAAVAAFCFMYFTPEFDECFTLTGNTKVAMTAPTGRQVSNIMYPEISRLYHKAKALFPILPGRLVGNDIRTDYDEWFLTGFKADEHNHEAWSGFHAVNTMFVITEASGISESTFAAIEGNLQGNSKILIVFNANSPTGYAAVSQQKERWKSFRLDCLNAPNVLKKEIVIPGQVDYEWVKDKVENWCEPISQADCIEEEGDFRFEGAFYRPNDLFRIKVRGMFPKEGENVLIPLSWIEAAERRYREKRRLVSLPKSLYLGVDVAGMGRDSSVLCPRYKNIVEQFTKHQSAGKADHMHVAGLVAKLAGRNPQNKAFIDTIGEGAGVYSRLVEQNYSNVYSCKFSERAKDEYNKDLTDVTGEYEFENMRAYLFWAIRDFLNPRNQNEVMLCPNASLKEELTAINWEFSSSGKIKIEAKEKIKERIGRSPDDADALANTFYPTQKVSLWDSYEGIF